MKEDGVMRQRIFNCCVDMIDFYHAEEEEKILQLLCKEVGFTQRNFADFFQFFTDTTIFNYIKSRKLYFSVLDLIEHPEKDISEEALETGYANHSSYTRAIQAEFQKTPMEMRKMKAEEVPNRKLMGTNLCTIQADTISRQLWRAVKNGSVANQQQSQALDDWRIGRERYGFDWETCDVLIDLAEHLHISAVGLMDFCFQEQANPENMIEQG